MNTKKYLIINVLLLMHVDVCGMYAQLKKHINQKSVVRTAARKKLDDMESQAKKKQFDFTVAYKGQRKERFDYSASRARAIGVMPTFRTLVDIERKEQEFINNIMRLCANEFENPHSSSILSRFFLSSLSQEYDRALTGGVNPCFVSSLITVDRARGIHQLVNQLRNLVQSCKKQQSVQKTKDKIDEILKLSSAQGIRNNYMLDLFDESDPLLVKAIQYACPEMVAYLIDKGANPYVRCHHQSNIFHVLAKNDSSRSDTDCIRIMRILPRCFPINTQDSFGHTPLRHAVYSVDKNPRLLPLLLGRGADPNYEGIYQIIDFTVPGTIYPTYYVTPPFKEFVARMDFYRGKDRLKWVKNMIKLFLAKGADIHLITDVDRKIVRAEFMASFTEAVDEYNALKHHRISAIVNDEISQFPPELSHLVVDFIYLPSHRKTLYITAN